MRHLLIATPTSVFLCCPFKLRIYVFVFVFLCIVTVRGFSCAIYLLPLPHLYFYVVLLNCVYMCLYLCFYALSLSEVLVAPSTYRHSHICRLNYHWLQQSATPLSLSKDPKSKPLTPLLLLLCDAMPHLCTLPKSQPLTIDPLLLLLCNAL